MNFNSRHIHYQNDLPLFMLKHIAKCIEKKFNISDANEHINEIFKKYKRQYEKKQNYDKEYFTNSGPIKQRYNILVKEYNNVCEQNDKLREFIRNKYGVKL